MTYQEQIKAIEDYMDASLGVNGEITRRAEEAVREMKAASGDLISRQAAIDAVKEAVISAEWEYAEEALEKLPSVQPDHIAEVSKKDIPSVQPEQAAREMKAAPENEPIVPNDVNFWCKRARYYESLCGQLMADIAKGVTLDSMSINENGITFTKSKEPVKEMKAEDLPEINVGKMYGYVFKRLEKAPNGYYRIVYDDNGQEYEGYSSFSIGVISDYLKRYFFSDTQILKKQVSILTDALDGCPLTNPCDKLWAPHGWCEEHCGENQQEPSKECWLKYAEVMASEG